MNLLLGFFTGMPGPVELLIVAGIFLLLFGNRLPSAMRNLGRSVVEFKKGVKGVEDKTSSDGTGEKTSSGAASETAEKS